MDFEKVLWINRTWLGKTWFLVIATFALSPFLPWPYHQYIDYYVLGQVFGAIATVLVIVSVFVLLKRKIKDRKSVH